MKPNETFFICFTPLHSLIAEKIITEKHIESFSLIYISENRSPKNMHYYSLLSAKARHSVYILKKNSVFDSIRILLKIYPFLFKMKAARLFTGNIKTFYSRFIIWALNPQEIFTFDDGIGNIRVQSSYFLDDKEIQYSRVFFTIVAPDLLYKNIKKKVIQNFTIYNYPNVFQNSEYISLFLPTEKIANRQKAITVLLSSALAIEGYMSVESENRFYNKIIEAYDVHLLIRHPRNERFIPPPSCTVSNSFKIAEDQIIELSRKYQVTVIGTFFSTVLVNIPDHIRKLNIITESTKTLGDYNSFFDSIGIETKRI